MKFLYLRKAWVSEYVCVCPQLKTDTGLSLVNFEYGFYDMIYVNKSIQIMLDPNVSG